jgi:hypothetical protein
MVFYSRRSAGAHLRAEPRRVRLGDDDITSRPNAHVVEQVEEDKHRPNSPSCAVGIHEAEDTRDEHGGAHAG